MIITSNFYSRTNLYVVGTPKRPVEKAEEIFQKQLRAQSQSGAKHAVWGPLSMEPFLPPSESLAKTLAQERRVARTFFQHVTEQENLQIHLCFPKGDLLHEQIFENALKKYPSLEGRVLFHKDRDSAQVAQDLANEKSSYQVSLAHVTHRKCVGRSWLSSDKKAYGDDLHSRSTMLSYFGAQFRRSSSPADTIRRAGGLISRIDTKNSGQPSNASPITTPTGSGSQ